MSIILSSQVKPSKSVSMLTVFHTLPFSRLVTLSLAKMTQIYSPPQLRRTGNWWLAAVLIIMELAIDSKVCAWPPSGAFKRQWRSREF
jgi:hypothetical protein